MKLIIADDEPLARRRLRDLIGDLGGHDIIGEAGDGTIGAIAHAFQGQRSIIEALVRLEAGHVVREQFQAHLPRHAMRTNDDGERNGASRQGLALSLFFSRRCVFSRRSFFVLVRRWLAGVNKVRY